MSEVSISTKLDGAIKAIEKAKSKGVTAIKVELEANLGRQSGNVGCDCDDCNNYEENSDCNRCDEGRMVCPDISDIDEPHDDDYECGWYDCNGSTAECNRCDGDYQGYEGGSRWSDMNCMRHIFTQLGLSTDCLQTNDSDRNSYEFNAEASDWLQYMKFYFDGSVDSEVTFTVRLDRPENIAKVVDVINAFKSLAEHIGNGMDVNGAGMHMAWLFSDNYSYPVSNSTVEHIIGSDSLVGFRQSMADLMPALFFLAAPATGKNWTRRINYRVPGVGIYQDKYSAIHISGGAMEFRVFDTCYEETSQIFDNVIVMANTLKFLAPATTRPKFNLSQFGNDNSMKLDRLYYQEGALDMLYEYVKVLKPDYYTMRDLRKQRGFKLTKRHVSRLQAEAERKAELAWQEYQERMDILKPLRVEQYRAERMRHLVETTEITQLREMTREDMTQMVEERVQSFLQEFERDITARDSYVGNITRNEMRIVQPSYRVIK